MRLDWSKLLRPARLEDSGSAPTFEQKDKLHYNFEDDIQRILTCAAFRRLQGKTQVHPHPRNDYVRTRLTHSLEVAHFGRSLSRAIFPDLFSNYPNDFEFLSQNNQDSVRDHHHHFSDVVFAACLAHDIGNPPFGHMGEYAIHDWFEKNRKSLKKKCGLSDDQIYDFVQFDGNAQGFRVLTRLQGWRHRGGLQLFLPTLGAFLKYPITSKSHKHTKSPIYSKFGSFNDDANALIRLARETGLLQVGNNLEQWCRHPLAYIVEAADDICYLTTDIEDAYKAKIVSFSEAQEILHGIAEKKSWLVRYKAIHEEADQIAYLRFAATNSFVEDCKAVFLNYYDDIMSGNFRGNLIDNGELKDYSRSIRKLCEEKIWVSRDKMEIEAGGFHVISDVLDNVVWACIEFATSRSSSTDLGKLGRRTQHIIRILPGDIDIIGGVSYKAILYSLDFLTGMTDEYCAAFRDMLMGYDKRRTPLH